MIQEELKMSFVHPRLRPQFESLSIDLKNEILKRNVKLYTPSDLLDCLNAIAHCQNRRHTV